MAKKEVMEDAVVESPMAPLTDDFQREDLNKLRDAVNALIAKVG